MAQNRSLLLVLVFTLTASCSALAHDESLQKFQQVRKIAQAAADAKKLVPAVGADQCRLTVVLLDSDSRKPIPGLIRVSAVEGGGFVRVGAGVERDQNWSAIKARVEIAAPRTKLKIEAIQGLETELMETIVDLRGRESAVVEAPLRRFYKAASRGMRAGNTHLHLNKLTRAEADRYLQTVPDADALDLVFVSYLRRVPDDRTYISNSYSKDDLVRLSRDGVLFGNGEEHRHNFEGYGEGYGHVMFLNISKLIEPVSIGPGIMQTGTDGLPLQHAIKSARADGAATIWCHNKFGLEDIPDWMAGLLDAQNIFDGGAHGSYEETFYRYLNIGLKVPFSTGTDWFIYDFARVYLPVDGRLTARKWLATLAKGKTFITNGPFLEFDAAGNTPGDTIKLKTPGLVNIRTHAVGRSDFRGVEVIQNGRVDRRTATRRSAGHFEAGERFALEIAEPGWIALRVPLDAGKNEFGQPLFAHTSPIYIEIGGKRIFQPETARALITEIEAGSNTIEKKAKFADQHERERVLKVHREGIRNLREHIEQHERSKQ